MFSRIAVPLVDELVAALEHARESFNRAFVNNLDSFRDLIHKIVQALSEDDAPQDAYAVARVLMEQLDGLERMLNDFTGSDLENIDLRRTILAGIRWSYDTKWPSDWIDRIRRDSVELAPGIFVIRGDGPATRGPDSDLAFSAVRIFCSTQRFIAEVAHEALVREWLMFASFGPRAYDSGLASTNRQVPPRLLVVYRPPQTLPTLQNVFGQQSQRGQHPSTRRRKTVDNKDALDGPTQHHNRPFVLPLYPISLGLLIESGLRLVRPKEADQNCSLGR